MSVERQPNASRSRMKDQIKNDTRYKTSTAGQVGWRLQQILQHQSSWFPCHWIRLVDLLRIVCFLECNTKLTLNERTHRRLVLWASIKLVLWRSRKGAGKWELEALQYTAHNLFGRDIHEWVVLFRTHSAHQQMREGYKMCDKIVCFAYTPVWKTASRGSPSSGQETSRTSTMKFVAWDIRTLMDSLNAGNQKKEQIFLSVSSISILTLFLWDKLATRARPLHLFFFFLEGQSWTTKNPWSRLCHPKRSPSKIYRMPYGYQ